MRVLSLALVLFALLAPPIAAQEITPATCEIRGHLSLSDLHVLQPPGVMHYRSIEDRDVRVTPIGRGIFRVRTHGGTPRIDGRTDQPVPISLAATQTFMSMATVSAGTEVDAIEPVGDAFHATLPVHEGALLRNVPITCRDLVASPPTDAGLDTAGSAHGPVWRARISRFRLRATAADDVPTLLIELDPHARTSIAWIEGLRVEGWVQVRASLAHALIVGWARDTDLALP